jgi:hypothetical protein
MKITKAELKEIIREEAYKFKKKLQLESELAEIESQLNEVETSGTRDIPGGGGHGYGKKFEKVPNKFGVPGETHTIKEDETEEVEADVEATTEEGVYEEDTALEEILAEIMAEDEGQVEECGTSMEETDHMEEVDHMEETDHMEEMIAEGEIEKAKGLISEQVRMKQLAGVINESEAKVLNEDWAAIVNDLLGSDGYVTWGPQALVAAVPAVLGLGSFGIAALRNKVKQKAEQTGEKVSGEEVMQMAKEEK